MLFVTVIVSAYMNRRQRNIRSDCENGKAFCFVVEDEGSFSLEYRRGPPLKEDEINGLLYFLETNQLYV